MGWCTTFEILECIRVADIVEPFFVFGINTSVFVAKTYITIWDYCNGSAMADQTTDQLKRHCNTVLLQYVLTPVGGVVYILEQAAGSKEGHICSIHKPLVKSTFSKHFTQIQLKTPLRYPLRQNPPKSSISPFFTPSKITTIPPKIPSNP